MQALQGKYPRKIDCVSVGDFWSEYGFIMLAASSEKRNVTTRRPSVRLSV